MSEESNDDSFGIDRLSMDYDYLLYKISDYVSSIEFQTNEICKRQNVLITENIVNGIVDENIENFKEIVTKCEKLENYFDMLDQINMITENFKTRITLVARDYRELQKP
ncbi:cyclin cln1 [Zygosaccharomyces mellis]|uniref:Biogenesis of lysosome-related organelles complex 1 subunit CNL1 n=1 Tax=Zygosaccharomyces mellis TaxID=42258 RepID=A0A4C2E4H3_9SACH|nr:cyclin cln1 [Zygosaccharomyces mellis]